MSIKIDILNVPKHGNKHDLIHFVTVYSLHTFENNSSNKFKWFETVKDILCSCGLSGIWVNYSFPNKTWLVCAVRQKLKDILITHWLSQIEDSSGGINYRIFKTNFGFEQYLISLPINQQICFMQIRTRNHQLPVETGRWQRIQRDERLCNLCQAEIGDEFHYMFVCEELQAIRKQYMSRYYYAWPNTMKFSELFNTRSKTTLRKLCELINS